MHRKHSKNHRRHSYTPLALDCDNNIIFEPANVTAEPSSMAERPMESSAGAKRIAITRLASSSGLIKQNMNMAHFALFLLMAILGPALLRIVRGWNSLTNLTAKGLHLLSAEEVPAAADPPTIWTAPADAEKPFILAARITHFPSSSTRLPAANTRGPLPPLPLPLPAIKVLGTVESWWAAAVDRTAAAVARTAQFAGFGIRVKGSPELIN
ncbi:hypothetical protein HDU87_004930 [Geranomyces variabilis]|uniref:Uncharacterized protein n=1 Tax=Geranomyces variabilis TaxID=109894 RepID=A0AAD5XRG7_9FUNG|nr:hypothetical protein HDU87_004930 [Geranomyces variabilis]